MENIARNAQKTVIQRIVLIVIPFILLITALVISFKSCERNHRLGFVPKALKVSKIVYAQEESRGIGPSGNESGVIVYELPEDVAEQIKKSGITFFSDSLASKQGNDDRAGEYEKWEETPLLSESAWREAGEGRTTAAPQIENYLNRYGFGVSVEPDVAKEINLIVSKGGAYFARGRGGIIIVSPETKRVIYTYSG